jgi:hypothetical protein
MYKRVKGKFSSLGRIAFVLWVLIILCGCGGGGGGDGNTTPQTNSDWDQMVWDQNDWA